MRPTDKVATSNLGRKDEHARHGPAVINPRVLAGVARVGRAHDGHLAESQPAAALAAALTATALAAANSAALANAPTVQSSKSTARTVRRAARLHDEGHRAGRGASVFASRRRRAPVRLAARLGWAPTL